MDKDKEKGQILTGDFTFDKGKSEKPNPPQNQSNPLYKKLFKLVHFKIDQKNNYKSFSDFKPKDLR